MPYNKSIDQVLVELEPVQGMLQDTKFMFRIKKYGNTDPKLEITKTFWDEKSKSLQETQRLGRIDISCLADFGDRITEAEVEIRKFLDA